MAREVLRLQLDVASGCLGLLSDWSRSLPREWTRFAQGHRERTSLDLMDELRALNPRFRSEDEGRSSTVAGPERSGGTADGDAR